MGKKQLVVLASGLTALLLVGAGCSQGLDNNSTGTKDDQTGNAINSKTDQDNYQAKDDSGDENTATNPTTTTASTSTTGTVKEFTMTAKNWEFSPANITVNKGDKVRIKITSVDVDHSFVQRDYGLNVKLEPGKTQTIEFVADKVGTFGFRCGVPCGEGHRDMTGTIIVQ